MLLTPTAIAAPDMPPVPEITLDADPGQDAPSLPFLAGTSYGALAVAQSYPVGFGAKYFRPETPSLELGFRHMIGDHWLMGYRAGFRLFQRIEPSEQTAILALTHETSYLTRMTYPLYLFGGPRLVYLMPLQGAELPTERIGDLQQEVGVALGMGLLYIWSPELYIVGLVERWRGTMTNRLHGIDVSIGWQRSL